jgi:hypothetical protein
MHTRQGRRRGNFLVEMEKKALRARVLATLFSALNIQDSVNIEANRSERQ